MNEEIDPLELLAGVGLIDERYSVYARATYYPQKIKVFVPFNPYSIGLEKKPSRNSKIGTGTEEDKERSIKRTRTTIRDYILCNQFDLFCTFTFRNDRYDINKCKTRMNNWLKNQQKRYGKFEYLIVPEFHKDDKAIHFHALFKNFPGKLEIAIDPKTGQPVKPKGKARNTIYSIASYTLGFSNAMRIGTTPEDYAKVANYVRKYITKDMPVFLNKNRYWASHSLKTPIYEENPTWYKDKEPYWSKPTEHGMVYLFHREAGILPEGVWD